MPSPAIDLVPWPLGAFEWGGRTRVFGRCNKCRVFAVLDSTLVWPTAPKSDVDHRWWARCREWDSSGRKVCKGQIVPLRENAEQEAVVAALLMGGEQAAKDLWLKLAARARRRKTVK